MSDERRDGKHPSEFSRDRRVKSKGGCIPDGWQAKVIDLDAMMVRMAVVASEGAAPKVWLPYEQLPGDRQVEVIGIVEHKRPGEQFGAYVSQRLAEIAGLPWWLVMTLDASRRPALYRLSDNKGMVPFEGTLDEIVARTEMPIRREIRNR